MARIRNKGTDRALLMDAFTINPRHEQVSEFYSWDPNAEIVSHEESLWMFDLTAPHWSQAIAGSAIITIPEGTGKVEIYNGSANLLKIYNYKQTLTIKDANDVTVVNRAVLVPPTSVRYLENLNRRCYQIEIIGTAALGEVNLSFMKK